MLSNLKTFAEYFHQHKNHLVQFYSDLLKIPSISTDTKHQGDCKKAAHFVSDFITRLGFQSEIYEENHHYLVFGSYHVSDSVPTLMFYGHTDVQPCDPLELWDSPPFEPTLKEGQMYARGAQDNKGQLAYTLLAIEAFLKLYGPLKTFNLKLVIEGEEESGSIGTEKILKRIGAQLKSDELYIVDFDAKSEAVPALILGMRGLVAFEVKLTNANIDLHSGMYGGVVYNPLRALAHLIDSCFTPEGFLAFEGAYEALEALSQLDQQAIDFSFDPEHLRKLFDVGALCVPRGKTVREANWLLPTLEINGLIGGYAEQGVKTVLPKEALAKISCRIGKNQNPEAFLKSIENHLRKQLPKGFKMAFIPHQAASSFYTSLSEPAVQKTQKALKQVFQVDPWIGLSGASVPIVGLLQKLTQSSVALLGVGLDTDQIHAPNEHFSMARFEKGFQVIASILLQTGSL